MISFKETILAPPKTGPEPAEQEAGQGRKRHRFGAVDPRLAKQFRKLSNQSDSGELNRVGGANRLIGQVATSLLEASDEQLPVLLPIAREILLNGGIPTDRLPDLQNAPPAQVRKFLRKTAAQVRRIEKLLNPDGKHNFELPALGQRGEDGAALSGFGGAVNIQKSRASQAVTGPTGPTGPILQLAQATLAFGIPREMVAARLAALGVDPAALG